MASSRGDRVAMVLPPTPETAAAFFATWKVGAILLSMSVLYGDDGIRHRLTDSEPKVLVTDAANAGRFERSLVEHLLILDDDAAREGSTAFEPVDTAADDPAQLYYSSGTTGLAKGILHAHRYLLAHEEFVYCHDVREGELFHGMGEWAWAAGICPLLGPWRYGAVQAVYQREGGFDPDKQLDFLSRHEVSNVFATPTAIRSMMSIGDARTRYPQQFRIVCSAGEPLNPEAIRWFREQYGVTVLDYYGLTESYPLVANYPFMDVREGLDGEADAGLGGGDPRRGRAAGSRRRARRDLPAGAGQPDLPARLLAAPRGLEEVFGGDWFHSKDAAPRRRGRLLLVRGAGRRRDHLRRLPDRAVRGRVGVPGASGRRRGGGRSPRPTSAAATWSRRSSCWRRDRSPRTSSREEIQGVRARAPLRVRVSTQGRVRRGASEDADRQDQADRSAAAGVRIRTKLGLTPVVHTD